MANNCNKTFRDLINDGQAQVLGIVSIVPMGDWNGTTTYQKLNYVRHNGATYLAKVANNNVEPRVAANWEDVWMLCNYDGGLVVPDGTYPDLTAGQVLYPLSFGSKTYNGSSAQTVTAADLGVASAYIPQGSITFANLPSTPSAATLSYVWDISDQFTTDSRFIEGAGQTYSAGTNVGVIEQNGNYYYDVFGSFVDLSNYAQINGTYSGMTVGKATQADNATAATDAAKLGGVVAENYAQINGTYSGMTVGAATKATKDGSGNNIVDTYVDKASEQVITGRKVFYGDTAPLNVKYETQESGDTFSYAPVTFYDNADKKLGAVQGQKTGNGTVQAGIDVYDKDGNYAASMGLKWDHSTQNVFPFAPSGQNVVPNGDSSDKIICSEFLQGATIYYNFNTSIGILGYRNKGYNISFDSNFTTSNGGYINVTRSGNVITISGWLRNRTTVYNGTSYVLLRNLPTAVADSMGIAPYASMNGVCRAYINAGGRELYFTPAFLVDTTSIASMSWFSISLTYITNE